MIKANDLRLGNWVNRKYWNPEPNNERFSYDAVRVGIIKPMTANLILKGKSIIAKYPIEDLQPITLTPELLEKSGFEKENDYWNLEGFKIWHDGKGFYHINSELLVHIDYLHQLQNLFYSLTGTELEINLSEKV
jgi:hypothetical protein